MLRRHRPAPLRHPNSASLYRLLPVAKWDDILALVQRGQALFPYSSAYCARSRFASSGNACPAI